VHPEEFYKQVDVEETILTGPKPKKRRAYKLKQKLYAILFYFILAGQGFIKPGAVTAHKLGIPKGTFDPWLADRDYLFRVYLTYPFLRKSKRISVSSKGKYHEEEQELYLKFCYRRAVLKLPVSQEWLIGQFRKILTQKKPDGWDTYQYSDGWVCGFCVRFAICSRAMTNKKDQSILERLPDIRRFHRYLIYFLPRMSWFQQCPKYGAFAASNRYHMDQIPMPFVFSHKRTLHFKGATEVAIRHPAGSGLDKRQCTLQLTIRAAGGQNVQPMLIFRGAGHVSDEELNYYESLPIRVVWQKKAWADRRVMMDWLDGFIEDIGGSGDTRPEVMLGMDQHGSQMVDEFTQAMTDNKIFGVYTPVNCTDVTAPIDHHVGARIKDIISKLYVRDFENDIDHWTDHLQAKDRRKYIADWVVEAWDILKTDDKFFMSVFQSCAFCNAKDGSENHLVKVGSEVINYNIDDTDEHDISFV
jgi:hypothetical protein